LDLAVLHNSRDRPAPPLRARARAIMTSAVAPRARADTAPPASGGNTTLVPSLTLFDATAMSVGAIIGAGIYVVIGIAARQAGPALIVSIVIAALMALLSALSIAELTRWLPTEGSSYSARSACVTSIRRTSRRSSRFGGAWSRGRAPCSSRLAGLPGSR
jgi:amino acid permease-like protein